MFWAVVRTQPNSEKKAQTHLERQQFETLLPRCSESVVSRRGVVTRRVVSLFPNYLLIRVVDRWHSVFGTRGVVGMIMNGERPARVHEHEMVSLRALMDENGIVELGRRAKFEDGQKVLVGAVSAIVDGTDASGRVAVMYEMLGRKLRGVFDEGSLVAA